MFDQQFALPCSYDSANKNSYTFKLPHQVSSILVVSKTKSMYIIKILDLDNNEVEPIRLSNKWIEVERIISDWYYYNGATLWQLPR